MQPAIRTTRDADNILTIRMDVPGKPVNACSPQLLHELLEAVVAAEHDRPAGVIFASAKPRSFNAGADLFETRGMTREQLTEYLTRGQALFVRIAHLPMPTIAAINGDCLGGGFELALACRYRVAVDDGSISIGLPEVKLGLIPAWGGTTRLPRTIGLRRALPILLAGKTLPPRKAQRAGLVDEVVRPEALLAAAKRIVTSRARGHHASWFDRAAAGLPPVRSRILDAARRETIEKTHGNYPAPLRLLDVVRAGFERGFAAGLEEERRAITELTGTDAGRNLLRLFFLRQGAKKRAAERVAAQPHDVKHAAVIGGGTMGAGITHTLIRAGIPVRLVEVDPPAVAAALGRIKRLLDDDVSAGKVDRLAARHALNRVSPTTEWTGLELADFVIEAVVETIDAKRDIFARLDRLIRPGAVLATNTSSLRVSEMAQATLHPERIVGLHFFNPVAKMPLVEVVRAAHSDDASLATAIALAVRLGKTPVLVSDAPGFLVNRILVPYLAEALAMAGEGVSIRAIDDAMKRWGMPMGAFELLDEIGLDIAAHVVKSLGGPTPPPNVVALFDRAEDRHWLGKKSGQGFYVYPGPRGRRGRGRSTPSPEVNEELIRTIVDAEAPALDAESIQWRLVLPMVNESARALEEGVTDSTDAIDLATVLGLGLAPFRGGIVQFANAVGAEEIVRRLDELAEKHGPRFVPAPLLREAARRHGPMAPHSAEHPAPPQQEHAIHT
ncbi:MAG: 3-hydroxyacyl-CoA dehydrogenase NAD-binding domain-containing protein [Tepidisphaeraceae bacterium]